MPARDDEGRKGTPFDPLGSLVAGTLAMILSLVGGTRAVHAEGPRVDDLWPSGPCAGVQDPSIEPMEHLFEGFTLTAIVTRAIDPNGSEVDAAELSWDIATTADAFCVWVQMKRGAEGYDRLHADYVLRPYQHPFVADAAGLAGEFCFRAMLISERGRSAIDVLCAVVDEHRQAACDVPGEGRCIEASGAAVAVVLWNSAGFGTGRSSQSLQNGLVEESANSSKFDPQNLTGGIELYRKGPTGRIQVRRFQQIGNIH